MLLSICGRILKLPDVLRLWLVWLHFWFLLAGSFCKTHHCIVQHKDGCFFCFVAVVLFLFVLYLRQKYLKNISKMCNFPLPPVCTSFIGGRASPQLWWLAEPTSAVSWLIKVSWSTSDTIKNKLPLCPPLFFCPIFTKYSSFYYALIHT